jgi:hypothetical protein
MIIQSSYPVFESGQVLTSAQLNELVDYLEQQERLTRTRLAGIGIVCGLEADYDDARDVLRLSGGCAVTSEGYLIQLGDAELASFRAYTVPVSEREEADEEAEPEEAYPFLFANGTQRPLWELLPEGHEPASGEPQPTPLSGAFVADKAVLLFVERRLEPLKSCDINDCSDKGAQLDHTVRTLLVGKQDAEAILELERQIADRPVDRHEHPRHGLSELRIEKLDVAVARVADFPGLLERILEIALDAAPALLAGLKDAFAAYGYLLRDLYPGFTGAGGPFDEPGYFGRAVASLSRDVFAAQYFYDYLRDVADSHNEFLRTAARLEAECCPDPARFPRHVLLGAAPARSVAFTASFRSAADALGLDPLAANTGAGVQERAARYRHHFIPSTLFADAGDALREVRSLHYRTYLLAYRYDTAGIGTAELRVTPSRVARAPLSERAIPFYYRFAAGDDLHRNWSWPRTRAGRLADVYAHALLGDGDHPLRRGGGDYDFFRVEGAVGRPLGSVLRELTAQRRRLGLPFVVQPVYLSVEPTGELSGISLDRLIRTRALLGLRKLLLCRTRELDIVFIVLMKTLFHYIFPILSLLSRERTSVLTANGEAQPPAGEAVGGGFVFQPGDVNVALGMLGGTPLTTEFDVASGLGRTTTTGMTLGGGRFGGASLGGPDLLTFVAGTGGAGRVESTPELSLALPALVLEAIDSKAYHVGDLTARFVGAEAPEDAVGLTYLELKKAAAPVDLYAAVLNLVGTRVRDRAEEMANRLYPTIALLDAAEELVKVISAPSIVEFDHDAFRRRYAAFVTAHEVYANRAAKSGNGSATTRAVLENARAVADRAPRAVVDGLVSELTKRLAAAFEELVLERYAQSNPGMEHQAGVPEGGTLILVYGHRRLITEALGKSRDRLDRQLQRLARALLPQARGAARPTGFTLPERGREGGGALDDYVVLADFCVPYLCCDAECEVTELEPAAPPAPAGEPVAPVGRQPGTFTGTIFGRRMREGELLRPNPIPEPTIAVIDLERNRPVPVVVREGEFSFSSLPGAHMVLIEAEPFEPQRHVLTVEEGVRHEFDIVLHARVRNP